MITKNSILPLILILCFFFSCILGLMLNCGYSLINGEDDAHMLSGATISVRVGQVEASDGMGMVPLDVVVRILNNQLSSLMWIDEKVVFINIIL
uniref:Uncharacterized protein n=1 Tax=Lactuca sativa TaxID=4236 RepID=A0A9R1UF71_LACSA|nr:hypothetical protein LSAT_V11C900493830 [Lactuca sativa]